MKIAQPSVGPPKQPQPFACPTGWCCRGGCCPICSSFGLQCHTEQLLGCRELEQCMGDSQARYQLHTQCSLLLHLSGHAASFIFSNVFLVPLTLLFVFIFFLFYFLSSIALPYDLIPVSQMSTVKISPIHQNNKIWFQGLSQSQGTEWRLMGLLITAERQLSLAQDLAPRWRPTCRFVFFSLAKGICRYSAGN